MITLKTLEWGNFYTYGKSNKIELNSSKLTQILGDNGAGKSSIPLILQEIIFNKNSKGIKKAEIPNRNTEEKGYWGKLSFSVDSDEYSLLVSRPSTTLKASLYKNNVDISGHTSTDTFKTVEALLIDFKLFEQLFYQSQYSGLSFLTDTDTTRKQFLNGLLKQTEYADKLAKIKSLLKTATDRRQFVSGQLSSVVSTIASINSKELAYVPIPAQPELAVSEAEATLRAKEAERSSLAASNERAKAEASRAKEIDTVKAKLNPELLDKELQDTTKLTLRDKELYGHVSAVQSKIKDLKKAPRGTCPTCKSKIDSSITDIALSLEEKLLAEYQEEYLDVSSKLKEANKYNDLILENQKVKKYLDLLGEAGEIPAIQDLADINQEIKNLSLSIAEAKKVYTETLALLKEAEAHNSKIEVYKEQLSDAQAKLDDLNNEINKLNEELSILEVLSKAFGNSGLVTHKLHELTRELSNAVNSYLEVVSAGRFQLNFSINGEKLDVVIYDGGKEASIQALSSGEQARVTISTLLAIRRIARSLNHIELNVLFLDEIMNVLDPEGRETLIEVLLEEENLNCFIVSHGWSHPLLDKIEVVKEGNISVLK